MTHQEILEKAIKKAIAGGWDMFGHRDKTVPAWYIVSAGQMPTPKVVEDWVPNNSLLICGYVDYYFVWEHVIFNHDFAKALWGDTWYCSGHEPSKHWGRKTRELTTDEVDRECEPWRLWQWHLSQMVLADDPIAYLGENS